MPKLVLTLPLITVLLCACGQKGPLYLPDKQAPRPVPEAPPQP